MKQLDRTKFLEIGGACIAGITVSQLDFPYLKWLSSRTALAAAIKSSSLFISLP